MKKQTLILTVLVSLAVVSCAKHELEPELGGEYIRVTATVDGAGSTRVLGLEGGGALGVSTRVLVADEAIADLAFVHTLLTTPVESGGVVDFSGATSFGGSKAAGATSAITFESGKEPKYDQTADNKTSYLMGYRPAVAPTGEGVNKVVTWTPDGTIDILLTKAWSAGTYDAPVSTGLTLGHALARLEVTIQSRTADELSKAKGIWGQITAVKFKEAFPQISLNFATNAVTSIGTKADFSLLNGSAYAAGEFTATDIVAAGSSSVTASAMLPPTGEAGFVLKVTSELQGEMEVPITLDTDQLFAAGKRYAITLVCDVTDKKITFNGTAITDWNYIADNGTGDMPLTPPVILEYGVDPHPVKGSITGAVTLPYKKTYGTVAAGTNGDYQETQPYDYTKELPYYKFEVARLDIKWDDGGTLKSDMTWDVAQGTTNNNNLCASTMGQGWRLPRLQELKLIHLNRATLDKATWFTPLVLDGFYWSATELSGGTAWCVDFSVGGSTLPYPKNSSLKLRCVRDMPAPPLQPVILEYGKLPYNKVAATMQGATDISYNDYYGLTSLTNGPNQGVMGGNDEIYLNEKPFAAFEVARADIEWTVDGGNTFMIPWATAQGSSDTRSDNLCYKIWGAGWRLPRIAELRLIRENRVELQKAREFEPFSNSAYWSCTHNWNNVWYSRLDDDDTWGEGDPATGYRIRCIKEQVLDLAPTVLTYNALPFGNVYPGINGYTTESRNGLYGEGSTNGSYQGTIGDALTNEMPFRKYEIAKRDLKAGAYIPWAQAQGTADPKLYGDLCATTLGNGWRLPRISEFLMLDINYAALKEVKDGFVPPMSWEPYLSSTEVSSTQVFSFEYGSGGTPYASDKQNVSGKVRCIREVD